MESARMREGLRKTIRSADNYEINCCLHCQSPKCVPNSPNHCPLVTEREARYVYEYLQRHAKNIHEVQEYFFKGHDEMLSTLLFLQSSELVKLRKGVWSVV